MVKIVNPLGDVKIGKQGEVVYQRKYGEQIRRQVSPKRAIASQAQIAHRQLYRAALDWRKQLSLPNRRYLEGYCIANGIVDGYHLPLAWSRFALKLYLEKVRFVVITKPIAGAAGEKQLYEHYNGASTGSAYFLETAWRAQTFTPTVSHKIVSVKIRAYKKGSPGILTVSIRNTDGAGKPTGIDLCSGTIDCADFTTDPEGDYYEITLGEGTQLDATTKYAIVMRQDSGDASNSGWLHFNNTNPYAGGCYAYSVNSGETWTLNTAVDYCFEEYGEGEAEAGVVGLLHVRHPALLTIVHKRGELTINGYDTLSSLDEEYLTKQVGLDVDIGDIIEATTLPGIEYSHQVS